MRAIATRFFALLPALLLPACGEVRWHKPGTDEISISNELAACRSTAHNSIQRMYGPPQPSSGHPWLGATIEPSPADRQMREQETVSRCMREKGYTLVPVQR